jgi:Flp pilus assembly pilin Flp
VHGRGRERGRRDRGAAVVEFALVSVLLTVLFLGLVQVGLALHVRNTLVARAAEGARHGALADRHPADGAAYAADLISRSLSPRFARDVRARVSTAEGQPVVEVTVHAPLPVIGLLGPRRSLTVRGHAMVEGEG